MSSSKPFSLGKVDRLKSRKQIDNLFLEGRKINVFPIRLQYRIDLIEAAGLKAGFTVSSRNFPLAVDRNRIKRLIREAYRVQKSAVLEFTRENKVPVFLFFIYTGREIGTLSEISEAVKQALGKLIQNLNAVNIKNN